MPLKKINNGPFCISWIPILQCGVQLSLYSRMLDPSLQYYLALAYVFHSVFEFHCMHQEWTVALLCAGAYQESVSSD